jgi:hypothetical protein
MVAGPRNQALIENKAVTSLTDSPRDLSARAVSDKCPKIHWPAAFRITATPRFLEAGPK